MRDITAQHRLWLIAAIAAVALLVAGSFAFAGRGSTRGHVKPSTSVRRGVDDMRQQGPSDPPGLVGVPVP